MSDFDETFTGTNGVAISSPWANAGGDVCVYSSNCALSANVTDGGMVRETSVADGTLTITFANISTVAGGAGAYIRYVDDNNYIMVRFVNGDTISIHVKVSGSYGSPIDPKTITYTDTDVLDVVFSGSSVITKQNGVTRSTGTITDHLTATKHGFIARSDSDSLFDRIVFVGAGGGGAKPSYYYRLIGHHNV